MGLDNFRTDNEDSDDDDEQVDKEPESEDESGGSVLDSFKTDSSRGGNNTNTEEEDEDKGFHDLNASEWNSMSKSERILYVRENFVEDFHPDFSVDDRWTHEEAIELTCVCDNIFTFKEKGVCFECGRKYKDAGRTVVMIKDIKDIQE